MSFKPVKVYAQSVKHDWSIYQKAIFKDIAKETDHTVVIARAGSGKTSVLIEGCKYLPKDKKTLMVAFNTIICDELKARAPSYVEVRTLNSFGFQLVRNAFQGVTLDNDKARNITSSVIGDDYKLWDLNNSICKCVSLCKSFLQDTPEQISYLIDKFGIEMFDLTLEQFTKHVVKVLALCKSNTKVIDYNDQVWFCFVYNLKPAPDNKYDVIFIDETQDLNACQIAMIMSALKPTGRIIAVGDPAQCVHEDTLLDYENNNVTIGMCKEGDKIKSYANRNIVYNSIISKKKSDATSGVEIATESGKSLKMTDLHKIWVLCEDSDNNLGIDYGITICNMSEETDIEYRTKEFGSLVRKSYNHYSDALNDAYVLKLFTKQPIKEFMEVKDNRFRIVSADNLFPGMKVLSHSVVDNHYFPYEGSENLIVDKIVSIKKCNGVFYDIEVQNSANFFGNGILSHNSIYQFRGADSEAMNYFIDKLKAKTLPLPISYRCPKKIIKYAQRIVPDIEHHENAVEGILDDVTPDEMLKKVKPGDFILSRTNAPLAKYCMILLKMGVPANIRGQDIGANFQQFVKKSKSKTIEGFIAYVDKWRIQEVKRLTAEKKDVAVALDKSECLINLCEGILSIKELKENIEKLFSDKDDTKKVILSSTHKAKGLERDNVFVLHGTYRYAAGVTGEEANLLYVAATRAKKCLYLVKKAPKK